MDFPEKIRNWGTVHSEARNLERAAARQGGPAAADLQQQARQLRERADSLHREIYREIGEKDRRD